MHPRTVKLPPTPVAKPKHLLCLLLVSLAICSHLLWWCWCWWRWLNTHPHKLLSLRFSALLLLIHLPSSLGFFTHCICFMHKLKSPGVWHPDPPVTKQLLHICQVSAAAAITQVGPVHPATGRKRIWGHQIEDSRLHAPRSQQFKQYILSSAWIAFQKWFRFHTCNLALHFQVSPTGKIFNNKPRAKSSLWTYFVYVLNFHSSRTFSSVNWSQVPPIQTHYTSLVYFISQGLRHLSLWPLFFTMKIFSFVWKQVSNLKRFSIC